ncbi:hypothetical protein WJX72_002705 [[Myrmecia] bisecta]|uniref:Uncharacterized protein n=1 Tax=[Myrmecia] bisecta TaxID=41462 RepID=A0AAW1QEH5_9CHLO
MYGRPDREGFHGDRVIIATRNVERGTRAAQAIMHEVKAKGKRGRAEFMRLELSSLRSVHDFAEAFLARGLPLHRLINNAGLFLPPDKMTGDGMEVTLQVNYFAHVYLSQLLLPSLAADGASRILWVSSPAEAAAPAVVDWDNLVGKGYRSDFTTYARSKAYILMAAREMEKRLPGTGIDVYAVQPGLARTGLFGKMDLRKFDSIAMYVAGLIFGQPDFLGAIPTIYTASTPEEELTGKGGLFLYGPPYKHMWPGVFYITSFILNTYQGKAENPLVYDDEQCKRLYDASLQILSEKTGQRLQLESPKPTRLPAGVAGARFPLTGLVPMPMK